MRICNVLFVLLQLFVRNTGMLYDMNICQNSENEIHVLSGLLTLWHFYSPIPLNRLHVFFLEMNVNNDFW